MAFETELKLTIAAQDVPALLAHPLLAAEPSRRQRLVSTYFDTPKRTLLARRVAVRQRRVGRQTLLTVKTAGTVIGGLARRGEWEAPADTRCALILSQLVDDDTTLADALQALAGNTCARVHHRLHAPAAGSSATARPSSRWRWTAGTSTPAPATAHAVCRCLSWNWN
jgi:inorganic triphosphatase YgiF